MKNQMRNNLAKLVSLNIDLEKYFAISFNDNGEISIQGDYKEETEQELLKAGFERYEYLYHDREDRLEYKLDNVRVLLNKD
jgi:hypothetical protein